MFIKTGKASGGDVVFTAHGNGADWTSSSQTQTINTGLSTVTRFRWLGATANKNYQHYIDYDSTRTNGKQIAISCGTTTAFSSTVCGQTGSGNGMMSGFSNFPKITAISGGQVTINGSSAAAQLAVNNEWWAG